MPPFQAPGAKPPYLSEVHLAHGEDATWLHSRLRELCAPWGTQVEDAPGGRLRIPVQAASNGNGERAAGGLADEAAAAGKGIGRRSNGGLLSKLLTALGS